MEEVEKDTETFVQAVISSIPASKNYMDEYRKAQSQDTICSQLMKFCKSGWPSHTQLNGDIKKYWQFHSSFSVCDDLLLLWIKKSSPTFKANGNTTKDPPGPPRLPKMWT